MFETTDFSFGELFFATRISSKVPSGSRNHTPFDSNPCRWIELRHSMILKALAQAVQIILESTK